MPIQSKFRTSLLVLSLILTMSGCATIVKGTTQGIPIASDPSRADVIVDGSLRGQTPIDLELKRKRDHLVTIQKEGFQSKSVPIVKDVGGAVWGNILWGGLIGWGVDATSGAQNNLNPKSISVKLEPSTEASDVKEELQHQSTFVQRLNELDDLAENQKVTEDEYLTMRKALFKEYYPEMEPSPEN